MTMNTSNALMTIGRAARFAALPCCLAAAVHAGPMRFENATRAAGLLHVFSPPPGGASKEHQMLGGAAAEDFDGDGWMDLYVLQGGASPNLLYMNQRDGTFSEEAAGRGADILIDGSGVCAADFDADGDIDIAMTGLGGGSALLVNGGGGYFTRRMDAIPGLRLFATSPSWGDIGDGGALELGVGLWQQNILGNLFLHRLDPAGFLTPIDFKTRPFLDRNVFTARFADFNNDRLQDIAVTGDFGNSQLYENAGGGRFGRVTESRGVGTDENGMGSAIGDYDNDGDLDWFVSSIYDASGDNGNGAYMWGTTGNRLYNNDGNGYFSDATDAAGVRDGNWGWGAGFGDLDNDGDLDLYHVNGWLIDIRFTNPLSHIGRFNRQPARLFDNRGDGTFAETAAASGADDRGQGRGLILLDYDNDGDLDLFICNSFEVEIVDGKAATRPAAPSLLRNDTVNGNHWLKVMLEGSGNVHPHGIGSRVHVRAGGVTQMRELHASTNYLSQEPGRVAHFGLGPHAAADEVRVEWSDGETTVLEGVEADQALTVLKPASVGNYPVHFRRR